MITLKIVKYVKQLGETPVGRFKFFQMSKQVVEDLYNLVNVGISDYL